MLVPYDDETIPMNYAVRKLTEETIPMNYAVRKLTEDGKLPEGAVAEAYSYRKKTPAEVLPMIEGADNVVFMSEIYGASWLKNELATAADLLADTVHQRGGKFIVMSVSLPYDAARFRKADAIMLAYLPRSMPVDPGDKVKEMQQYGPNMPAALYMMFSKDDAPTAKLPVNIPQLDAEYNFTDTVLYARGFGLTYESEEPSTQPETTQPEGTTEGTTAAPATIAPTDADATSATQKTAASGDSAATTGGNGTAQSGNGTVKTGDGSAIAFAVMLLLALSAVLVMRFAKSKND